MGVGIIGTIKRVHCFLFGHKPSSRSIMAYSIDTKFMYYVMVRIHKVSKCERCGGIISEEVESYKKLGWCSPHFIKEEEKVLRKKGLLSITKAYQKLEGYEIGKGENG